MPNSDRTTTSEMLEPCGKIPTPTWPLTFPSSFLFKECEAKVVSWNRLCQVEQPGTTACEELAGGYVCGSFSALESHFEVSKHMSLDMRHCFQLVFHAGGSVVFDLSAQNEVLCRVRFVPPFTHMFVREWALK